ncbi:hypothetical protein L0657_06690 [Dyadobacter sp. CY345]|uniref:hypothetical protein n=1 Tax=Dyadobacter sp. CY345 TaxID=2909335 RepID=UPI001F227524|nr:hypothetical protein [Dyadobacter sp. CY345]MCF2443637.1 hypothetical protein [Dyadobacter sp. CY345]
MSGNTKCSSKCVPIGDKPANLKDGVLYAVECKVCGYHILFWKPQRKLRPKFYESVMIGEQKPLKLNFTIHPSFLQSARDYGHLLKVPNPVPTVSRDESFESLYEMLGDGEITLDEFNKMSMIITRIHQ